MTRKVAVIYLNKALRIEMTLKNHLLFIHGYYLMDEFQ